MPKKKQRKMFTRVSSFYKDNSLNAFVIFCALLYVILLIKFIAAMNLPDTMLTGIYGLLVSFYILGRFAIAFFYNPKEYLIRGKKRQFPTISFGIPTKNEEVHISETIGRLAQSDYPKKKFEIIVVNDGSTDNTLEEIKMAQKKARQHGVLVKVINWKRNRGKRHGMAACIKKSKNDIIIFIDSDSFVKKNAAKILVKYFADQRVGAVTGHAYVANANENYLTKMQAVRYFVSFKAYKGAEALFGTVTCCSGCCSAYRRSFLSEIVDKWLDQHFLGVKRTYGDDRSLTNYVLARNYKALYAPDAISYTYVPDNWTLFLRQQLRWKKSWFSETFLGGAFMWRKHPLASIFFYLGFVLTILAPFFVIRTLLWIPLVTRQFPFEYILGFVCMALLYGLYYYMYTKDKDWIWGTAFATFYAIALIWQLPWAILTLRDTRWGTR